MKLYGFLFPAGVQGIIALAAQLNSSTRRPSFRLIGWASIVKLKLSNYQLTNQFVRRLILARWGECGPTTTAMTSLAGVGLWWHSVWYWWFQWVFFLVLGRIAEFSLEPLFIKNSFPQSCLMHVGLAQGFALLSYPFDDNWISFEKYCP